MSTAPVKTEADLRREAAQAVDYIAKSGAVYERLGRALLAKDVAAASTLWAEGAALPLPAAEVEPPKVEPVKPKPAVKPAPKAAKPPKEDK